MFRGRRERQGTAQAWENRSLCRWWCRESHPKAGLGKGPWKAPSSVSLSKAQTRELQILWGCSRSVWGIGWPLPETHPQSGCGQRPRGMGRAGAAGPRGRARLCGRFSWSWGQTFGGLVSSALAFRILALRCARASCLLSVSRESPNEYYKEYSEAEDTPERRSPGPSP